MLLPSQSLESEPSICAAMSSRIHRSVMIDEVVRGLGAARGGLFFDGTLGLGGHSEALLRSHPAARVIGVDRDREAVDEARRRLAEFGARFDGEQLDFREAPSFLRGRGVEQLGGALLDLGVSSIQLEDRGRGFSFQLDGPLDMRMDRRQRTTAEHFVNQLPEGELADLIYRYGEESASRRIARHIVRARADGPIETTRQLATIVLRAVPAPRRTHIHPATKTFQALRIAVNEELRGLDDFVLEIIRMLSPGARLAVISFHSLEDRIIKESFRRATGQCQCAARVPPGRVSERCPGCGAEDLVQILTRKPLQPSAGEIEQNTRARSAKMRICERLLVEA